MTIGTKALVVHIHDVHQSDGQPEPETFDRAFTSLRSAQQRGEALANIHLTDKTRHITWANGISSEPHFTPDYRLYEISQPKPTRTLLHVQREYPHNKEWIEEWVFVCVKSTANGVLIPPKAA
ncbi:hypothetical protein [Corynebacterium mustelae]|uniref:hypothetical protein n=1 Tax=Corynebacterium mustelae TaxID=571915 RepID=UPI0006411957|nr:hypothetical protein [Corynebacterium mustelae]